MSIKRSFSKVKSKLKLTTNSEVEESYPVSPLSADPKRLRNESFSSLNSTSSYSNYTSSMSHSRNPSSSMHFKAGSISNTIPHSNSFNSIHLTASNTPLDDEAMTENGLKLLPSQSAFLETQEENDISIPEFNLLPPVPQSAPYNNEELSPTTLKSSSLAEDDLLSLTSIKLASQAQSFNNSFAPPPYNIQRPSTSMSNYSKNSISSDTSFNYSTLNTNDCNSINNVTSYHPELVNIETLADYNHNDDVCDAMAISILSKINIDNQIRIVDEEWCI